MSVDRQAEGMGMRDQQAVRALADRVRRLLADDTVADKRMFGGVTFLVNGNMLCCVFDNGLMIRVGREAEAAALAKPFVRPPSQTRKMPGFVLVENPGLEVDAALAAWLAQGRANVDPMQAKK